MTNREIYLLYIEMKLREGDWHAVRDAACDLEKIEHANRSNNLPTTPEQVAYVDGTAGTLFRERSTFSDKLDAGLSPLPNDLGKAPPVK